MKISSVGLAVASAAVVLAFGSAQAAENRHVDVTNGTSFVITEFYASTVNTNDWEEDILGVDTLAPGEAADINIDDGSDSCNYDFKAVFEDGDEVIKHNIDVCSVETFLYTE